MTWGPWRALVLAVVGVAPVGCTAALSELDTEEAVLDRLKTPQFALGGVEAADVERLVHRGWHDAVRSLVALGHRGSEAESQGIASHVRQAVKAERNRLDDLTRALDRNYGKAVDVSPACQWAQNSSHVFLTVKFAQRWNAPGALEVENETVSISQCCFNFTAFGEHSFIRRRYRLSLELFRPLQEQSSSWSLASVGRMTVTLAKSEAGNWPQLLSSRAGAPPKNLGIWRDMQEKWQGELKKFVPLADPAASAARGKGQAQSSEALAGSAEPRASQAPSPQKKSKGSKGSVRSAHEEEDDEALDREIELLADCPKATYAGSTVAELCRAAWPETVERPRIPNRRWLVELYSSHGGGDSEAMKTLMPVWKRLADVFPSMVPGGRVGALDCRTERELCKQLGVKSESALPQIRRFLGQNPAGEIWAGSMSTSIEDLAAFGGEKLEL